MHPLDWSRHRLTKSFWSKTTDLAVCIFNADGSSEQLSHDSIYPIPDCRRPHINLLHSILEQTLGRPTFASRIIVTNASEKHLLEPPCESRPRIPQGATLRRVSANHCRPRVLRAIAEPGRKRLPRAIAGRWRSQSIPVMRWVVRRMICCEKGSIFQRRWAAGLWRGKKSGEERVETRTVGRDHNFKHWK